jgi:DUF1365 family protein
MADWSGDHAFYLGSVFHRRRVDPKYRFTYRVFNVLVDIDRLDALDRSHTWFSHNRFNLFSLYNQDHLPADASVQAGQTSLRGWAEAGLSAHGIDLKGGRIGLFCYPRILGFVFNPLSAWYCWDDQSRLVAIICEVRNTFGERHCYLIRSLDGEPLDLTRAHHHPKRFHVSPFLPIDGDYEFRFNPPGDQLDIGIVWLQNDERAMIATQRMRRVASSDKTLLKVFFTLPLMTLKVVFAIHWQALKIWLRGGRFHKKPAPPKKEISSDV